MNRKELSQNHWKYYLMLEKRFVESIEFVELHEDNFDAFSNGYALLIQAIGAELGYSENKQAEQSPIF